MKTLIFLIAAVFLISLPTAAQRTVSTTADSMMKRCTDFKSFYQSITFSSVGDIVFMPCPTRHNIFNGTLQLRKNNTDTDIYSHSLDIVGNLATTEMFSQNVGANFNITDTPFSSYSSYTNGIFNTNYSSPNRAGGVMGLVSNASLSSNTPIHDLQAIHGTAFATNGSAASGLYGGVFAVGMFGGTNHGNVADLVVGASTVRDTDVRNYFRLWIKKPTMVNANVRDGRNLSIYQEGPFGSEFQGYVFLNNANAASSGAAFTPLQIKLANAQTAEALTVRDAADAPLFSVNAGGQVRIANPKTPASASDVCAVGTIQWDANNIYVCVAENTWRRSQLSSF